MARRQAIEKFFTEFVFEYETPKIIAINSVKIGLIYRSLQLAIIAYIIGYAIIYNRGYQDVEVGQSTITTKVKGIASSMDRLLMPEEYRRVWDYADYVVPPMSKDSLFIMTNAVLTPGQSKSTCPEDAGVGKDALCIDQENQTYCTSGEAVKNGNGVKTGNCIRSRSKFANYTCEIVTWCPLEDDSVIRLYSQPLLDEFENFTIFLKNVVEFPQFNVKRRNIDSITNFNYVKSCQYNPNADSTCPIFKVGDLIKYAKANKTSIAIEGGIINVLIRWDCDLDFHITHCKPKFIFSQMDESTNKFSTGFNFRFAQYYRTNGTLYRDLTKAYGVLFVFNVDAHARKFSIVQLGMNVGAGLALLGLASVLMDMVLTNFSRDRQFYKEQKFTTLSSSELKREKMKRASLPTTFSSLDQIASEPIVPFKPEQPKKKKTANEMKL